MIASVDATAGFLREGAEAPASGTLERLTWLRDLRRVLRFDSLLKVKILERQSLRQCGKLVLEDLAPQSPKASLYLCGNREGAQVQGPHFLFSSPPRNCGMKKRLNASSSNFQLRRSHWAL